MSDKEIIVGRRGGGHRSLMGARIDAVLWVLFFAWVGVTLLWSELPDGFGSLGIGAIVLAGALIRRVAGASISSFWLLIGTVFVLAGLGGMLSIDFPFLSIALIVCGVLMLLHKKSGRRGSA
jgi:hypothetical protein